MAQKLNWYIAHMLKIIKKSRSNQEPNLNLSFLSYNFTNL